jgi:hypothetical protein
MSSVSSTEQVRSTAGSPRRRRLRSAILPAVVSVAILVPNLVVVALGVEDFPFTTAPMFAHYVGPDTELYSFRIEGVRDGVAAPLPLAETNLDPREVQRALASWFYRPDAPTAPFRDVTGRSDDPAVFATEMAGFFRPLTDFLRDERSLTYDAVELYVDTTDTDGNRIATTHVGEYDPATDRYTQLTGAGR